MYALTDQLSKGKRFAQIRKFRNDSDKQKILTDIKVKSLYIAHL